jgi:hypothetical protein
MVKPVIDTVPSETVNTFCLPWPLMVSCDAPGPMMFRSCVMTIGPEVRSICEPELREKVIGVWSKLLSTAERSDPVPESAVLVMT